MNRRIASRLAALALAVCWIGPMGALAADCWVAPAGNDSNSGSRDRPYRTVQRAADTMSPGDTCTVRGGTYREAVSIRRGGSEGKPLRFIADAGERVILDGTDLVTGRWTRHRGAIYSTSVVGPVEQLFVDGLMQIEARWPNCRFEEIWDRTKWARSDHGSQKDHLICEGLAKTGIDWTGALATLNVGHQYKTWTRDVTVHSKGSEQFTYELNERLGDGSSSGPSWADDCFYLSGKLEALDTPTEWHFDADSGTLYLWCADGRSPAEHRVTIKRRTYAFDAFRCNNIQIIGFHFFGATLRLDECNHCVVDQCRLRFPVYSRRFEERTPDGRRKSEPATLVAGDYNIVRNTSLALSNLGGLVVRGSHCRVENCIVHDVNWGGNFSHAGLALHGSAERDNENVVSHCSIYGVGNIGIYYSGRSNTIEYNHVFGTGRACRDIAAIHTGGARAARSVAHHNWVHDSSELGMRGDDQTRHLTFHHNVVWNCRRGMIVKGNFNSVYHNTILVDPEDDAATASMVIPKRAEPKKWWTRQPTLAVQNVDTRVFNNAAYLIADRGGTTIPEGDQVSHNVVLPHDLSGVFIDATPESLANGTFDLRPAPGSPLIDVGSKVSGITEPYNGEAPDAGAYEAGRTGWVAGADWQDEPIGVQLVVRLDAARSRYNIPLPSRLYESGISAKGIRQLQKLYNKLWAEDDRGSARARAIALRERFPDSSPQYGRQHAIVAELHRKVWLLLRDHGGEVLGDADRATFEKTLGHR